MRLIFRFVPVALVLLVLTVREAESALPREFREVFRQDTHADTATIPIGLSSDGRVLSQQVDGDAEHVVFQVDGHAPTLLIFRALQSYFANLGYDSVFACEDRACGGFDFLAQIDPVGAPAMYVDVGDFRYLAVTKEEGGLTDLVGILVSRSSRAGFVQMTAAQETARSPALSANLAAASEVDDAGANAPDFRLGTPTSVTESFKARGRVVLQSLEFASGSLKLARRVSRELADLASYLKVFPDHAVVLVGHTDTRGNLESNIELSLKRAEVVMDVLIKEYGVDPSQLQAEGIGYLAPRATNDSAGGRARNRRVEAVLVTRGN